MTLMQDQIAVLVGTKNINFILGIIASYVKALGSWCNIFMRIQCNIVASHIRLVMLSSSRLQTICVQIYFTFVFLSLKSSFFCLKCLLTNHRLCSYWMKMITQKPFQRNLENTELDPGWGKAVWMFLFIIPRKQT